jgi:membrane fusion protein (multidrug efflux system)
VREVAPVETFPGRLEALETIEIRARVRGFLEEQRYEEGAKVGAGEILFVIERAPFEAEVQAAQAALAGARAARDISAVRLKRVKAAAAQDAANPLEVESAEADLKEAEAKVQSAQAELEIKRLDLEYTLVKSPSAGRAARSQVDIGNLVGATDATLLTTVEQDEELYAYFEVSERDVLRYLARVGGRAAQVAAAADRLPVRLILADGTEYAQPAFIDYVDPAVNRQTGTVSLRARAANAEGLLASGMFVRVQTEGEKTLRTLVPERAVQRDLAGSYVLTVGADGVVARANVVVEGVYGGLSAVEGLPEGARVIVDGMQRARVGGRVTVGSAAAAS